MNVELDNFAKIDTINKWSSLHIWYNVKKLLNIYV
jgi:hypothetical protein